MLNNPIILGAKLPTLSNPASASDVLSGKQLVDTNGNVLTGTIPTISPATPSISVNSSGLITASVSQPAGYVPSGTKSATKQLATQAATTITPGASAQTAVNSGRYTTGAVTVAGDSNLKAENIKSGVSIFGVAGSYTGSSSDSSGYLNVYSASVSISGSTMTLKSSNLTSSSNLLLIEAAFGDGETEIPSGASNLITGFTLMKYKDGGNYSNYYKGVVYMITSFSGSNPIATSNNSFGNVLSFSVSGNSITINLGSGNSWYSGTSPIGWASYIGLA